MVKELTEFGLGELGGFGLGGAKFDKSNKELVVYYATII